MVAAKITKAKIRSVETDSFTFGESVRVAAYQQAGFRRVVDAQLQDKVGDRSEKIVKDHVHAAVDAIRRITNGGFRGTSGTRGVGSSNVGAIKFPYRFRQLAPRTLQQKRGSKFPDRLWIHHGGSFRGRPGLREVTADLLNYPVIFSDTEVAEDSLRRGKKRIDFVVSIGIDEMNFPFDEMVRRPLLERGVSSAEPDILDPDDKASVLVYLEYGTSPNLEGNSGIPARPWIRQLSATVGERMFAKLLKQK